MDILYYMLDGTEIIPIPDADQFRQWFIIANRCVARTVLPGDILISTDFLGMDYAWGEGQPILFQTMIFWEGHALDTHMARYHTWDEAEEGHEAMVALVREALAAGP